MSKINPTLLSLVVNADKVYLMHLLPTAHVRRFQTKDHILNDKKTHRRHEATEIRSTQNWCSLEDIPKKTTKQL
jgi:hypothetical protein